MILPVKTSVGSYNIYLEKGALNNLQNYLNLERRVLIVTDSGVPKQYAEKVAEKCKKPYVITIKEGEESKSFENYELLLSKLVEYSFTRSDVVVAVGGGVVGDLAGFVAASYMRGIDFYNIPTTVLSQVDSSVGGKVAIDFCGYKNIVGAFYPPKAVIIDTETLKTLPKRQISNGLAESVKMSLTCNKDLFEFFETEEINQKNIGYVIEESLKIKRHVVQNDERESGLRKILNFGHTLAHAFESENKMKNLYHGECVALGMLPMCSQQVRERLIKVLDRLELPQNTEFDYNTVIQAVRHDKKMAGDEITVVYVEEIGDFVMKNIAFETLAESIKEVSFDEKRVGE